MVQGYKYRYLEKVMIVAAWDWDLELFDAIVVDVYIDKSYDRIVQSL